MTPIVAGAATRRLRSSRGMPSHLGQSIRAHVVLEIVGGINNGYGPQKFGFVRRLMDGKGEAGPGGGNWQVPGAHAFVLTEVDWSLQHSTGGAAAGKLESLRLFLVPSTGDNDAVRVAQISTVLGPTGGAGGNAAFTAGATFGAGTRIGVDTLLGSTIGFALLRGYLISLR